MLDLTRVSPQVTNMLFTFVQSLETLVFWIVEARHKEQLFLNKGYEVVWNQPAEYLFNDPWSWYKTIVPVDLERLRPAFINRRQKGGDYSMLFRVHRPDGEIRYLNSVSSVMLDAQGEPKLIAGVDEILSAELWNERIKNPPQEIPQVTFLKEFITVIEDNCGLKKQELKHVDVLTENKLTKQIYVSGNLISISNRESQCLKLLINGESAKQTACKLHLSPRTVETYLNNLRRKAECRTKLELIGKLQLALLE